MARTDFTSGSVKPCQQKSPWSVKPCQQKSAKPHALWRQAHAKLVPSKALFLPSWLWAPFLVWRKPTLPRQAIAPSILYIILICENRRSPGRERGGGDALGANGGDSRILPHGRGHWNRKESWPPADTNSRILPHGRGHWNRMESWTPADTSCESRGPHRGQARPMLSQQTPVATSRGPRRGRASLVRSRPTFTADACSYDGVDLPLQRTPVAKSRGCDICGLHGGRLSPTLSRVDLYLSQGS